MGLEIWSRVEIIEFRDLLCEGIAVDAAHGNAERTRLEDVVVGEALDQL